MTKGTHTMRVLGFYRLTNGSVALFGFVFILPSIRRQFGACFGDPDSDL
jgi:hypothetical protein